MTDGPNLELVLAQQANDAMARGADPKATTERLDRMIRHLRANPELTQHGTDALAQGADPGAITGRVWDLAQQPEAEKPGVLARAGGQIRGFVESALHHPVETAKSLVTAPLKSAADAFLAPGVGEARPDPRLSKGGNSAGVPIDRPPYDAEHGAVTGKERLAATGQTLANVAFPAMSRGTTGVLAKLGAPQALSKVAGLSAAGGTASAAYSPDDPAAAFLAGATLTPFVAGAAKLTGRAASGAASRAIDLVGRPTESGPLIKAGPLQIGRVEGLADRAARKNAEGFDRHGLDAGQLNTLGDASKKPLAPLDLAGVQGQRMARGLKTSSAPAEAALRETLQPRAEGAVDRVIEHGLETTGLTNRSNGLQTVDDLIAQRAQHGNENFPPVFAKHASPLVDPEFTAIVKTPAGKLALQRGQIIAANRGESIGSITELAPAGSGEPMVTPTLQQAHYVKLGFDDMLASPPEPGSGGSGPSNTAAIRTLKNRWLAAMDKSAPEYGKVRTQFADESDLIRAAQMGRDLWKMHPDEAAKAFRDLSAAERDVARRTGFDALAERIENGPKDVSSGASKPRDVKRMRLLFPDDASFEQFRAGLQQEAQMLQSNRAVLDGSNTADKIADMADMAGVSLPDIFRAARGNPLPLLAKGAKALSGKRMRANSDALAVEQAKQLSAGAQGDAANRKQVLRKIGEKQTERGAPRPLRKLSGLLPSATRPADQRPGR